MSMFGGLNESKGDRSLNPVNYGQISFGVAYGHWVEKQRVPLTIEEYEKADKANRYIQIVVNLDTQAINPGGYTYFAKNIDAWSADFVKIWVPGLVAVFGEEPVKADVEAVMESLQNRWVALEDVPQVPRKGQSPEEVKYKTPRLLAVYPDREACLAAYIAQYGQPKPAENVVVAATDPIAALRPQGYTADEWGQMVSYARERVSNGGVNALQLGQELSLSPADAAKLHQALTTPVEQLPF